MVGLCSRIPGPYKKKGKIEPHEHGAGNFIEHVIFILISVALFFFPTVTCVNGDAIFLFY